MAIGEAALEAVKKISGKNVLPFDRMKYPGTITLLCGRITVTHCTTIAGSNTSIESLAVLHMSLLCII